MLDYPCLAAIAAIVREGSFERAAVTLGITPSAVSQRVRGLEERLGAILIVRGTPCTATELGRTLCAHLDQVRLLEHDVLLRLGEAAAGSRPVTLRIAVNADSLATWFPGASASFVQKGGIALDLIVEDEAHTADRLRSGEVLAAVTADPEAVQGCRTTALGRLPYVACASPAFLAHHCAGNATAAALTAAPYLRFDRRDRLQHRWARGNRWLRPGRPGALDPVSASFRGFHL